MGGEVWRCTQCGKVMNIVERMLGPVCGRCARENHKNVIDGKPPAGKGY